MKIKIKNKCQVKNNKIFQRLKSEMINNQNN